MSLRLIRSDPSFAEPEQLWQFTSDFAMRDYSGQFVFKLIPCTVPDVSKKVNYFSDNVGRGCVWGIVLSIYFLSDTSFTHC